MTNKVTTSNLEQRSVARKIRNRGERHLKEGQQEELMRPVWCLTTPKQRGDDALLLLGARRSAAQRRCCSYSVLLRGVEGNDNGRGRSSSPCSGGGRVATTYPADQRCRCKEEDSGDNTRSSKNTAALSANRRGGQARTAAAAAYAISGGNGRIGGTNDT